MATVVALIVLGLIALPTILDGPARSRRRRGITVWDEMWARGEITAEQLYKIKSMENGGGVRMIIDPSEVSGETGWVCAFIACGQPANKPHVPECPYAEATS